MSNNRELSEFADYLTVDDTTKNVGIGTTLKISAGGIFVANTEVIRPDGTWGGPDTGLVGAQGAQGAQGFQGAVGAQGAQGAVGAQGAQGAQGYQGAAGSATITNNADNRVITGGSGTNLNGEANLTFDGSKFVVTGSDAEQLRVKGGEADVWLESTGPNTIWRILGSTGTNTHMFRIYDQTNSIDRFNINASGAFSIGGNNYGTSGQVLTSQGSSSAPQWATPSGATWTSTSVNAGPTGGVVAFTSIPSDIDFFIMSWNNVNSTNNNEYSVEMGHSGSYQTSGYNVNSGYMAQSSTIGVTRYTSSFYWRGSAGGGNNFGRIWFSRHNTGNVWHAFGNMHEDASDIIYHMSGSCSLGGTLDRIRLILSSGGFDSQGSVTIQYLRT